MDTTGLSCNDDAIRVQRSILRSITICTYFKDECLLSPSAKSSVNSRRSCIASDVRPLMLSVSSACSLGSLPRTRVRLGASSLRVYTAGLGCRASWAATCSVLESMPLPTFGSVLDSCCDSAIDRVSLFEACVSSYCSVICTPIRPDCALMKNRLIDGMHAVMMEAWSAL